MSVEPEKKTDDLEKALEEALAERNRLWAELNERQVDQRELEHLRSELKTVHDSTMWKLTGRYQRLKHAGPQGARAPARRLMAATVSVAIPVLNGARYLDEVLTAVRSQEVDRDVEIVIVDSGSTDGSLEIAERHGALRPPDRQERVLARRHAQPPDGARLRRPRGVPHPGRDARVARGGSRLCSRASSRRTTSPPSSAPTTRGRTRAT